MTCTRGILPALALSALLTACGGGGGDSSPSTVVPPTPTPPGPAVSVPLISSPTSTPGAGVDVEAVAAFNLLNDQRAHCGFGRLNWSTSLETVAYGHANWSIVNNYSGHFQVSGTPGFTGVTFEDRFAAAGLSDFTGTDEIYTVIGSNAKTGRGAESVRQLLAAPYHALGLLGRFTQVGISVLNATETGSVHGPRVQAQLNLMYANATGPQVPSGVAVNAVRTYPCAGTTGTLRSLDGENPNPVPGRDLSTSPIGQPVMIEAVDADSAISITSASITPTAGGAAITLLPALTQANDTNGIIRSNQAVLMPNAPLAANTSYTVAVSGTVNGAAFSTTFSWTTGN
jgi:uncharacterized protein YkwD